MENYLCLDDWFDEDGVQAFYAGEVYTGYVDDEEYLILEDESGDEVAFEPDVWPEYFAKDGGQIAGLLCNA